MRSKILQVLLLLTVIPFIAWSIFEKCEVTMAQFDEVMEMEYPPRSILAAAVAVALYDKKITQAEYALIKDIADKSKPRGAADMFDD